MERSDDDATRPVVKPSLWGRERTFSPELSQVIYVNCRHKRCTSVVVIFSSPDCSPESKRTSGTLNVQFGKFTVAMFSKAEKLH